MLIAENVVLIEGRLSIREEEDVKIVANNIIDINNISDSIAPEKKEAAKPKTLILDITNLPEETKAKLRGMIRFFSGSKNNVALQVLDNGVYKPCGGIYVTDEIIEEFENVLGKERVIRE